MRTMQTSTDRREGFAAFAAMGDPVSPPVQTQPGDPEKARQTIGLAQRVFILRHQLAREEA